MGNIERKLVNFSQTVYNQAAEESRAIADQLKKAREKELEKAQTVAEQQATQELADSKQRAERAANEQVSKTQLQAKNKLIRHREELEKKVFYKAQGLIDEFIKGQDYYPWLLSVAQKAIDELGAADDMVVYINASDAGYQARLNGDCGVPVELLDQAEDILGGVRVQSAKMRKVCNDTIAGRLEEMHSEFFNISGLRAQ